MAGTHSEVCDKRTLARRYSGDSFQTKSRLGYTAENCGMLVDFALRSDFPSLYILILLLYGCDVELVDVSCFIGSFKHVIWGRDWATTHVSRATTRIYALNLLTSPCDRSIRTDAMHHDICFHSLTMTAGPRYASPVSDSGWSLLGLQAGPEHKQTSKLEDLINQVGCFEIQCII
jgi:hypothetical protein